MRTTLVRNRMFLSSMVLVLISLCNCVLSQGAIQAETVSKAILERALNFRAVAKYDSARRHFHMYRRTVKLDDNSYVKVISYECEALLKLAKFDTALVLMTETRKQSESPNVQPNIRGFFQQTFGDILFSIGNYREAVALHKDAIDSRLKVYPHFDRRVIESKNNLAMDFLVLDAPEKALVILDEMISSIDYSNLSELYHLTYLSINKSNALLDLQRIREAQIAAEVALEAAHRVYSSDKSKLIKIYLQFARIGNHDASHTMVDLYSKKAIRATIADTSFSARSNLRLAYQYLAISQKNSGRFYHAKKNFIKSIKLAQKLSDYDPAFSVLEYLYIGEIAHLQGHYLESLAYLDSAKNFISVSTPNRAKLEIILYNHLGIALTHLGEFSEARQKFLLSKTLASKKLVRKNRDIAKSYLWLGKLELLQNQTFVALNNFQHSLIAISRDFESNNLRDNPTLDNLVEEYFMLVALESKANAMTEWARLQKDGLLVNDSSGLNISEKLQIAINTYELGVDLIDKMRNSYRGNLSKQALGERGFDVYEGGIRACLLMAKISGDNEYFERAFWFAQKGQTNILADALKEANARRFAGIPDSLLNQEYEIRTNLTYFETQYQKELEKGSKADSARLTRLQNKAFDCKLSYDSLITSLEMDYPQYYDLKFRNESTSIDGLRSVLGPKAACLNFMVGDSSIYVFAMTADKFVVHQLNRDSTLEETVRMFRTSLMPDSSANQFLSSSRGLYKRLIEPISAVIAGKQDLIIIPDGPLLQISFEALLTEPVGGNEKVNFRKLPYLLHKYTISYHYSTSLLANTLRKSKEQFPTRAFGGFAPVFNQQVRNGYIVSSGNADGLASLSEMWTILTRDGRSFNELPNSRREVKQILRMFDNDASQSDAFMYKMASEQAFKSHSGQYRYLHLATHSFANAEKPQLSGIAFSQPEDSTESEDGILYAGEIFDLQLNADLVVLSSCESGIGKLVKGEGMMAMTRGFLYAGASNVAVSLWKVIDSHTRELMVDFYRNIRKGKTYRESLRNAKLGLINNRFTAHPRSWSSFILIGQ